MTTGTREWHVSITVAGDAVETMLVRAALVRLTEERAFLEAVSFTDTGAQLSYWDQGASILDVSSLALRLWDEHRVSARLPHWEVVGLEVLEKRARHDRESGAHRQTLAVSDSL